MARSYRPRPPQPPAPPWFPGRSRPPRTFRHGASRKVPPKRRASRWLRRNRRLVVALLLCVAAGLAVQQLTPAPAATSSAWAAARDLPAGQVLAASDLAVVQVPPGLLPGGALDPAALEGKQLAVALRKGQLLADSLLVGPGMLAGSPPGAAAVPLRMADPASVQLVAPGQLINVVMTGGGDLEQAAPAQLLATAVPVLWTSARGGRTGQWLDTAETDGLMVVAADPEQARRLAGASTQGKLFFVLVGSGPG
ncbi:flagellar biosynthesis protein FlgA [Arthrobacter sp. UKPF54-2]|uniref:RcpC/CpaB family pilus assembly protein n=1 Tax=Arthrobacter sp. UKPF54-2 TaxID=2600159 RepID=UPI0011B19F9F|nr:RcpC/CpaB family pilus assembly protein [Arthrobacter sp. UKPF54-2]QDY90462.1 flagellar biosynthesis protein FlgA [Arthrobacter sp. UKPF54-2]